MIVIFAGPTIAEKEILKVISNAEVLPPVSMGDVYQAALKRPKAIGIVDGYFDSVPSVWHKEVLWALSMGIAVFGASSMGALRAAELHEFGMVGVGQIFEMFRDGVFEDDDEVALQHGPKELNYMPVSEPLVNIRATLRHASEAGVIENQIVSALVGLAKGRAYPERTWKNLFEDALQQGTDRNIVERLQSWIPVGAVDQKYNDALAMLDTIKRHLDCQEPKLSLQFKFEHTVMWEELQKQISYNAMPTPTLFILDCLRSNQSVYYRYRKMAAMRLLPEGIEEFDWQDVSPKELTQAMTRFRSQNGLFTGASFNEWLLEHNLELEQLQQSLSKEIAMDCVIRANLSEFQNGILLELEADGQYHQLKVEADRIAEAVSLSNLPSMSLDELGLNFIELQIWYFETLLEIPLPNDLDHFLHKNDFLDRREFEKVMICRFIHWRDQQRN